MIFYKCKNINSIWNDGIYKEIEIDNEITILSRIQCKFK